ICSRSYASAPARPAPTRFKGIAMKKVFAIIAMLGAFALVAPAFGQDKDKAAPAPAAPAAAPTPAPAATPAPAVPAAAPAAAAPAATAAPAPTPNKGDVAWMLTSTALV